MRKRAAMLVVLFVGVIAFAAIMTRSAANSPAEPIPDTACLDCHESEAASITGTAHDVASTRVVRCVTCHSDVTARHLEEPEEAPPHHLAEMRSDSLTNRCAACHAHPHSLNMIERDPHETADVSCAGCHRVHGSGHPIGLLHADQTTMCTSCHPSTRSDFFLTSHHPVMEGVVSCGDCHITVAQSSKQRTGSGAGEVCVTCHAVFAGPFPFEHQAAVEYSTDEGGCLNCHAPHGSAQPRLLRQPYEAPAFSLCSQCHVVPKHQFNANHGSLFAGVACSECHVDVHGSYESRHLLDPGLAVQGCFVMGCHQL